MRKIRDAVSQISGNDLRKFYIIIVVISAFRLPKRIDVDDRDGADMQRRFAKRALVRGINIAVPNGLM